MRKCKICGFLSEVRYAVCFDCANFESMVGEGVDMRDNPPLKRYWDLARAWLS